MIQGLTISINGEPLASDDTSVLVEFTLYGNGSDHPIKVERCTEEVLQKFDKDYEKRKDSHIDLTKFGFCPDITELH